MNQQGTISKVVTLKPRAEEQPTQRVAPMEAICIKQADLDSGKVERKWHGCATSLRARINRIDQDLSAALEAYTVSHRAHRAKGLAGFQPKFGGAGYWLLLGLVYLLELPLNASALEIWQFDDLEKYMVATALSLVFLLVASAFGRALRHFTTRRPDWMGVGVSVVTVAGLCAAVAAFTDLRQAFLVHESSGSNFGVSAAGMFAMQLFLFLGGVYVSFNAHCSDGDLEQILRDKERLRGKLAALLGARAPIAARYDRELGESMVAIRETRDKALAKIAEYRDYAMRHHIGQVPSYFRSMPDERLFRLVNLGQSLDAAARSLDELIRIAEERAHETHIPE